MNNLGLVLSGGGARGAYQAGVLCAWRDILPQTMPFQIISGVSAGTINSIKLAEYADDTNLGLNEMASLWKNLQTSDIYNSDFRSVLRNLYHMLRSGKEMIETTQLPRSFLSTEPFYHYLLSHFDMSRVHHHIEKMAELCVAINCFDYTEMKNVTFFQTQKEIKAWERQTRRGIKTHLNLQHIMSSIAVPFIFPAIHIQGHYFGDGSLRNMAPLSPAVKLGAKRIISINLRGQAAQNKKNSAPNLGHIVTAIFNSIFLDAVEFDTQMMLRINRLTEQLPHPDSTTHSIELCNISPDIDFGSIALKYRKKFPRSIRTLLGGWTSPELLSYLLFDGEYCAELIELGERDGKLYRSLLQDWINPKVAGTVPGAQP